MRKGIREESRIAGKGKGKFELSQKKGVRTAGKGKGEKREKA